MAPNRRTRPPRTSASRAETFVRRRDHDVAFPLVLSVAACNCRGVHEDFDRCYRAVQSKDARFDGWFVTAVLTTGIYCRPSCPVRPPFARNVRFYPTAAAAQRAGFRACKRCRPDASPGSPEWNVRGDVVARAMRLIADGTVDRDGVAGLAARLGYTTRQLERLLQAEVGAGPLALARAQRAQTARVLIETTDLPFGDVAFAAGFSSIRQFNDTVRLVFDTTPTSLRTARRSPASVSAASPGTLSLRLPVRTLSPTRAFSVIWPPPRCPAARRSATAPTGARCGSPSVTASSPDPDPRPRQLRAGARRLPRPGHRHRPVPPAARSRRRSRSRRRGAERRSGACARWWPRRRGSASPAPSTSPSWPCGPSWASRYRPRPREPTPAGWCSLRHTVHDPGA